MQIIYVVRVCTLLCDHNCRTINAKMFSFYENSCSCHSHTHHATNNRHKLFILHFFLLLLLSSSFMYATQTTQIGIVLGPVYCDTRTHCNASCKTWIMHLILLLHLSRSRCNVVCCQIGLKSRFYRMSHLFYMQ